MSIHFVKLVELLSINQVQDKTFLHIVVYTDKMLEMFWEVDLETATNLQHICAFDGNHKYRLSLRTTKESNTPAITSQITKTYLNQSTRTDFFTTEHYRQQVELIKKNGSSHMIQQLPFLITPGEFIQLEKRAAEPIPAVEESLPNETSVAEHRSEIVEDIELSTEEIAALTGPYQLTRDNLATSAAHSKADTSAVVTTKEENEGALDKPLEEVKQVQTTSQTPHTKWLALVSLLLIAFVGVYVLLDTLNISNDVPVTNQSTYTTYEIEEPFIFKLPANQVALTFDKGPSIYTQGIMDILTEYKVGATFFVLGSNLNTFPLTLERLHHEGYAIGHATMNYSLLTDLPYEKIESEWLYTAKKIEEVTGQQTQLFRPPYGLFNKNTLAVAEEYGFHLVTWSVNPFEAHSKDIDSYLQSHELSGAIIALTESQETIDVLPTILDTLLADNLNIVQLN